jgi:hypothetical protein
VSVSLSVAAALFCGIIPAQTKRRPGFVLAEPWRDPACGGSHRTLRQGFAVVHPGSDPPILLMISLCICKLLSLRNAARHKLNAITGSYNASSFPHDFESRPLVFKPISLI